MRKAYTRDKYGSIWKHFDSEIDGARRKIMLTPEMADALPQPIKFKRDDFREQGSKCCCGKTVDEINAENTNQPREEI